MGRPHRIGIVGLGSISGSYLDTLAHASSLAITAIADLNPARATDVALRLPATRAMTVAELMASDDVDTVLNLTIPAAHADIALTAIENGKNVYGEKPLAVTMNQGRSILDAADRRGVRVGSAPDTVLGTGTQTARAAIDRGVIGRPLAATAMMVTPGHESWHHNPDFYYMPGGGPLLDMGPYYVAALIHMLGPVRTVVGAASRLRRERTIAAGPRAGTRIPVEVRTHVSGVLEHENGVLTTITTSFDAVATTASPIEVHGDAGTLLAPDPNQFDGAVRVKASPVDEWQTMTTSGGFAGVGRGIGLLEFIAAVNEDRPPRASGEIALHSLEVMLALLESADHGHRVTLQTRARRPSPVELEVF